MRGSIPLGRVLGIRIGIHFTFFLIVAWMAWLGWHYDGPVAGLWAVAMVLLLFSCVILHELGHSVVAMRFGVEVSSITLLPIGGVAAMRSIPDTPWQEMLIAVAGPAVNVLLLCLIVPFRGFPDWIDMPLIPQSLPELVDALVRANMVLVIFNLLPAFPMDGGRIFRAALAMCFKYTTATAWASGVGRIVAVLFVILGASVNPFLVLIGIFIFLGAEGEYRGVRVKDAVRNLTVADLMRTNVGTLRAIDSIRICLNAYHKKGTEHFVVIGSDGTLRGILPAAVWMAVLKEHGPDEWIGRHIVQRYFSLSPHNPLHQSIQELMAMDQDMFPVLLDRAVVGILAMDDVRSFVSAKLSEPQDVDPEPHEDWILPAKVLVDLG